MKPEELVPKIIQIEGQSERLAYGTMIVEIEQCFKCERYMTGRADRKCAYIFPLWREIDFNTQLKKAGWVMRSPIQIGDQKICVECADAGKADFLCALCNQRRPTSKIQSIFGDPPEFLCKDCYETVTAEKWDKKVNNLYECHKYDFE